MRYAILVCLLWMNTMHADDWTPPENPDPQVILQEARADTRGQRYETALAKHVWFHENALAIQPAFYGVRLSFALMYWKELAQEYPPALAKLKQIRDTAQKKALTGQNVFESFHDMEAINKSLGEQSQTKEIFEVLHKENPESAKEVFELAQPALIRGKAYSLVNEYLSPEDDFTRMRDSFRHHRKLADDAQFGAKHLDYANKQFTNDVTTLVAILAVNDRKNEAADIVALARAEWDADSFNTALDQALQGVIPDPWPK